jgi:DNA helicase-2/ATP-dependent DNA helicase PcrA
MMPAGTTCWNQGLVGCALRIAETEDSPLRVLAGPGTGKTFALMRRVMRLLEDGCRPRDIFVCTFTRTAARDLETELSQLRARGVSRVRTGTIHAFCFSLLSHAAVLPITGRFPRPLLKFEERFLMEDLKGINGEGIRDLRKRLIAFGAAWARLQSETPGWPQDRRDRAFFAALNEWLRFHKAMLIGELVPETLHFLRNNPESPHRPHFEHVLVDEYQDLNRAEQVLLDELAADGSLTVIGDENQSIYSFKHAHPAGIAEFDRTHHDTHDESLDECRRCPRSVVRLANTLIRQNPSRVRRILRACPGNPDGEVLIVQWPSLQDEAEGLASFIQQRIGQETVEPGRVLVLAPRRQVGYAIRDALIENGILSHSFFYEEALDGNPAKRTEHAAQEAFTLLTLLANPDDRVALRCWCGFGSNSLNRAAWARVRRLAEGSGDSPLTILERLLTGAVLLPHTATIIARFRLLRQRLEELNGLNGTALVDALFPGNEDWAQPIRTVLAELEDECEPAELLETIRRGVTQPELPNDVDYVRVMSLHKSKGLTADLVVVASCIEGFIPFIEDGLTPDEEQLALEEQRRLFYVAITRTTQTLILSSMTQLPRAAAHKMGARVGNGNVTHAATIASRFFGDLGPDKPATVRGQSILEE